MVGVKPEIDAIIWHGGNVQHSLTADSGYTMSLELESQLPEDNLDELADASGGNQTKPRRLTHLSATKASAQRAVDREWQKMQSASA